MSGNPTVTSDLQTRIQENKPRSSRFILLFVLGLVVGMAVTVIAYERYGFHLQ
jgi:hypothetical protein